MSSLELLTKIEAAVSFLRTSTSHPAAGALLDDIQSAAVGLASLVPSPAAVTSSSAPPPPAAPEPPAAKRVKRESEGKPQSPLAPQPAEAAKPAPDLAKQRREREREQAEAKEERELRQQQAEAREREQVASQEGERARARSAMPAAPPFNGTLTVSELIQAHQFLHAPATSPGDRFVTQNAYGGRTEHACGWSKNNTPLKVPYKLKLGEYTIQAQNRTKSSAFADRANAGACVTWVWLGGFHGQSCRVLESGAWNGAASWTKAYAKPVLSNDVNASMVMGPLMYA
ncbi:hypothetical protein TeGR_g14468 [Tetraparma gracilis]|uniref:Uncharacterized protein n=1 Tax=Tetraparma gracilis TaxID=2962635 RepID=A0ABQ6MNA9_9STRA|nr:hypothetical protein TeGR_g14468 [Tetraparma gracilis]